MKNKLVTILGPSASGKTGLALELAQKYHGQIICADSRTIYRGMNIGTAKPTVEQQQRIKHYLLDIVDLDQAYSAKDFKIAADAAITSIRRSGELPFLVGGSGMYIDAVLFDYKFRSPRLYPDVNLDGKSLVELIEIATTKYPQEIAQIDTKNRRRVEQLILKGPAKDDDRRQQKIDSLVLGLSPNLPQLKQNIEVRTDCMLNNGLVQEAERLRGQWGKDNIMLQTTGYSAILRYLTGEMSLEQARWQIIADTLALTKKQMTWFRRNKFISWVQNGAEAEKLIDSYLKT